MAVVTPGKAKFVLAAAGAMRLPTTRLPTPINTPHPKSRPAALGREPECRSAARRGVSAAE
ncbi:MAG: hypothetical protein R3B96_08065 [Pirellulaceae bacterium]